LLNSGNLLDDNKGETYMKVIVCVKQVPDMTEAKMDREAKTTIREGVASIVNP